MVVVLSSANQQHFIVDPVLKAARERQAFSEAQLLANPRYERADQFVGVDGIKAFGVALDAESGRVVGSASPEVEAAPEPEAVAGPIDEEDSSQADVERVVELEAQLATAQAEQETAIEHAKAQAFAEGQAQGQLEAKQMIEMESGTADAERSVELRDMLGQLISEAKGHLIAHQDLFDPLKSLALALAEQIARRELTLSDDSITAFIERSLTEIDPLQLSELVIHVSNEWYERLQQPELEQVFAGYTLRRDDTLQPGSVRLAVQDASVDDFIEQRVAQLGAQLLTITPPVEQPSNEAIDDHPVRVEDEEFFAGEFDDQGAIIPGDYSEVDDIFFQRPEEE